MKAANQKSAGFTLTELLVVLGCVTLLAATLLPALAATKLKELSTQCLGNLRQLAMTASIYQTENKNIPWQAANQAWAWSVLSDPNNPASPLVVTNGSYGLNGWLYQWSGPLQAAGSLWLSPNAGTNFFGSTAMVAHPRQTPEFMDAYWPDLWPYQNGPDFAANWYPYDMHEFAGDNTPPYNGMARCFMMRHGNRPPLASPPGYAISRVVKPMPGGINVSFVDGHASYTRLDDLWLLYWNRYAVPVRRE